MVWLDFIFKLYAQLFTVQLVDKFSMRFVFSHWVKIGFDEQKRKQTELVPKSYRFRMKGCVSCVNVSFYFYITINPKDGGKNHLVYIWYRSPKNFRCSRLRIAVIWSFRRWYGRRSNCPYSV